MARKAKASSEVATIEVINPSVDTVELYDGFTLDQINAEFGAAFSYSSSYIEKGQIVTGKLTGFAFKQIQDRNENDWNGNANPRFGSYETHLLLTVDEDGCDTLIDKKLCYTADFMQKKPEAIQQFKNRIANPTKGLAKQIGKKPNEFIMSLTDMFNMVIASGKCITIAKVPFGEMKDLKGNVSPKGYVLEFDVDNIRKVMDKEAK